MLTAQTLPPRREPNIEHVSASLPCGTREHIRRAAAAECLTMGAWVRQTIEQRLAEVTLVGGANALR